MKQSILFISLLTAFVSTAHAAEKVIKGRDAATIMQALQIISDDGSDELSGVEINSGASQEGISVNEDVTSNWTELSGKIGSKSVECSSQVYMMYKVAKKNRSSYKDTYECKIK